MTQRFNTLAVIAVALLSGLLLEQLPREPVTALLRAPWPDFTWPLMTLLRVGAPLLLVAGLYRYVGSGRRSARVIASLGVLAALSTLQAFSARVEAPPVRLGPMLEYFAFCLLGLEFMRVRKR